MAQDEPTLTATEVAERLAALPGWTGDASQIEATYVMATFPVAVDLVGRVAESAEAANHHPDIDIRWRRVTFRLTTHDSGGVTAKDLGMAERIQSHARGLGWEPS
jgi:4a-hydroxytetrahydrobiopterin dehydratase